MPQPADRSRPQAAATDAPPSAVERCTLCGSDATLPFKEQSLDRPLAPEDLRITDHGYGTTLALWRCDDCGFLFAAGPDVETLVPLYEALSDPDYQESQDTRRLQMRRLLAAARRARPQAGTLLDVGAGSGLLVAEAERLGLDATGVEPSRALVEAARHHQRVELLQGVLPHFALSGRRFDIVCLVDVLEHVQRPVALLEHCKEVLAPSGLLLVVTPDVASVAARLLGRRWWHFRLAHVGYFDRRSLSRAVDMAGLEVTRWSRAKWYFRVRYVAERTAEYLPVGWLNHLARRLPPLDWLYRRVIPLNLFDSYALFLRHRDRPSF